MRRGRSISLGKLSPAAWGWPGRVRPALGEAPGVAAEGSRAQRRLCALVQTSPPRSQRPAHGRLQCSEQTSEGKAQVPAWEKSPHTSPGRCVGMGTEHKDGKAGTRHRLGPPACAPAWLEMVSMRRHTACLHISPGNPSSYVTVGIALIQDGLKRIWSQNHFS